MFKKILLFSTILSTIGISNISIVNAKENQSTIVNDCSINFNSEWSKAKKEGYTKEQFNNIMSIPKQPIINSHNLMEKREMLSPQQSSVLNTAKKYLGVPYVWGGTSPSGFDCSGLVQYVYKEAINLSLPRVTTEQEKCGKDVSLNNLKVGDLLFWGDKNNTYHVAIYVGNGQYIHAPQPGETVKYGEIKYWKPDFARRVLPESSLSPIRCDNFMTIISNNTDCYTDKTLTKVKQSSKNLYQKTLHATNYIINNDGKKYYELYNNKKEFQGYLCESALKISDYGSAGSFISDDYYIKIHPKGNNAKIWKDLELKNSIGTAQDHVNEIYHVKGHYNNFNGYTYLSLYDSNDKWFGYVNRLDCLEVSSVLNDHHSYKKYGTIINTGFNIYKDTMLKKAISSTNKYLNKTVYIRGYYDAYDNHRYMSIFEEDKSDLDDGLKWIGYVDSDALKLSDLEGDSKEGVPFKQKPNTLVSVQKDNIAIWKDLNFTQQLGVIEKNHWYEIKNKYHHFNNDWYASIYDVNRQNGERTFIGYANMDALKIEEYNFGEYHPLKKMVIVAKKDTKYGLYTHQSLSADCMINNSLNMAGNTYYAQGYYDRIPTEDNKKGGRFYSIRESKDGKWLGYMRSTAFEPIK
ncbi:C40 family peptidase [Catellicoccus marimammalium]|uniref:NlpC/P60 domain-containing protein n=1 Tax=Catellicoccus marimammalium M35/04/3 TaxID=1234409 RepID=K8ZP00_9ENTE|nr:C40 family peptidase [Catellicoccus marimammalium]EKU27316.1 hypothetical protein C683_0647 [Catellicoccus marimammalium M35/04/3]